MKRLDPSLRRTLEMIAEATTEAVEPWWIIGSAAVALHGACPTGIRDVDLMMSVADAKRLMVRHELTAEPDSEHPQFRSKLFAVWRESPLPVEIFADFHIHTAEGWQAVRLQTREPVRVGQRTLFIPGRDELYDLLLSFGRAKDRERAQLLAQAGLR
jgi:hypothetical protein